MAREKIILPDRVRGRIIFIDNMPRRFVGKSLQEVRENATSMESIGQSAMTDLLRPEWRNSPNTKILQRTDGSYFDLHPENGQGNDPAWHIHVDFFPKDYGLTSMAYLDGANLITDFFSNLKKNEKKRNEKIIFNVLASRLYCSSRR